MIKEKSKLKVLLLLSDTNKEYWSDVVRVSVNKKTYPIELGLLLQNMNCCGVDEIDELHPAFLKNKKLLREVLTNNQVMFLTLKATIKESEVVGGYDKAFYIATMPTGGEYTEASAALDSLGFIQTKARKNPNTKNLIKVYIIDKETFLKKHLPK